MNDGIVLHLTKINNSMQASAKICNYLHKKYNIAIADDLIIPKNHWMLTHKFEYGIMVNSASAFCEPKFIFQCLEILKKCKKIIYVNNDYIRTPASQLIKYLKPRKFTWWSTLPDKVGKNIEKTCYVNWNLLTYDPLTDEEADVEKINKVFYWGALRPNRKEYFKKFLNHDKVTISTNKRSLKQFKELCPRAKFMEAVAPEDLIHKISEYAATIYMEDPYSHRHYCSPANRFYEALSARTAIFFEQACEPTFNRAQFVIKDYLVEDAQEMIFRLEHYQFIQKQQFELFNEDYQSELKNQIQAAFKETGIKL